MWRGPLQQKLRRFSGSVARWHGTIKLHFFQVGDDKAALAGEVARPLAHVRAICFTDDVAAFTEHRRRTARLFLHGAAQLLLEACTAAHLRLQRPLQLGFLVLELQLQTLFVGLRPRGALAHVNALTLHSRTSTGNVITPWRLHLLHISPLVKAVSVRTAKVGFALEDKSTSGFSH